MSFVWKRPEGRLKSPEQCAREILEVALEMGLDDFAAVLGVMCVAQESDFWCPANDKDPSSKNYPYDSLSDDGRSVAYLQQQNGRAGDILLDGDRDNWWGPMASRMNLKQSMRAFLKRLENNYREAVNDPGMASRRFIQNVQRSKYPDAYAKHWGRAWQLVNAAKLNPTTIPSKEPTVPAITGDPLWLETVLREALGSRLVVEPGWAERGAGGVMGVIWGTMIHHTGNVNESVAVIRDGVQQPTGWLPGPLSQCLIKPTGTVHLIAVGPCNHAGGGNYGSMTDGNRQAIGFECSYAGSGPWPDAQVISMRDATAAISKHLGKRANDSVCGHKEYAKPAGRKPDPGNMDMNWFRGEVQKDLDGFLFPGEGGSTVPAPPVIVPTPDKFIDNLAHMTDRQLLVELWHQARGPEGNGWKQLGEQSPVDFFAALDKKIDRLLNLLEGPTT